MHPSIEQLFLENPTKPNDLLNWKYILNGGLDGIL